LKRLYFIRHGETEWNKKNIVQGIQDIDLNEIGIQQAKKIALRLKENKIDAIYTSDLKRAINTANEIVKYHQSSFFEINPLLREIQFGEWEGLSLEELNATYYEQYSKWRTNPIEATFPGEGNLHNVKKRVSKFLEVILESQYNNIVIVTHGGIIKMALIILLDLDLSFYKKCWFGNASLSIIDIKQDKALITCLNDMSHLSNNIIEPYF